MKAENEKTPFTKYRDGYLDGYAGRDALMLEDEDYARGYEDGVMDDSVGSPSKFAEDKKT
mgnify:CR=1 FL=1